VLLGEPPSTAYDLNFRVGDVPVRVHPLFWLVAILLGSNLREPKLILIWVAVLFFSILIHELGHVLAYRYYGMPAYVVLHSFGGLAISRGSYGQYGRPSSRSISRIVISLAGPAAGFLFAALVVAILCVFNRSVELSFFGQGFIFLGMGPHLLEAGSNVPVELYHAIRILLFVNVLWGLVNLLPIYPLDGGQVSRELFLMGNARQAVHYSLMLSMVAAIGMALFAARIEQWFVVIMFGMLAYQSYQGLQMNRGGWGGGYGGGRPW
jgi:stage IV sporulation protein FB